MSFEENMTAFYMAFAENKLEQMCQALGNMRLVVQNDSAQESDRAAAATTPEQDALASQEASIREEMLQSCEVKAHMMLEPAVAQLKQACASPTADIDSILSQFYLCAELGGAAQAAPTFTGYLTRTFKTQSRAVLDGVAQAKKAATVNEHGYIDRGFYVEAMSEVMTGATDVMNAVADVAPHAVILRTMLTPIHEICADVALEIVHAYALDARMAAWERRAMDQARRETAEVEADESLQMVDLFLDELSFLIRVMTSYSAFIKSLCDGGVDSSSGGGFAAKTQELSGVYLVLERFYIFQSTHKATEIAEVHELEADVLVSSIVEDVSFVLNKAFFRSSQCMTYHTSLSIVIAIADALESTFLPAIVNLPRREFVLPLPSSSSTTTAPISTASDEDPSSSDAPDTSFSDLLLAAVDDDLTRHKQDDAKLVMAINSATLSGELVAALEAKIADVAATQFPSDPPLLECLPKPLAELHESFQSIVTNEVKEVLHHGIAAQLQPLLNRVVLERCSYHLTPAQYDACSVHGSPLPTLVDHEVLKNRSLRKYQRSLCGAAFDELVELLVVDLVQWIEAAIVRFKKSFNDLGALLLEREATQMLDSVATLARHKPLRGCFTRLFQIVLLLNLMEPSEVHVYAASLRETLTVAEIEAFLRMRVDFQPDAVRRAVSALRNN